MAADDANYIYDLEITKPAGPESAGDGDDEIRTVKRSLKNTFPGNEGLDLADWNDVPDWVPADPDYYDGSDEFGTLLVGPRFLNQLPKTQLSIALQLTGFDTRIDALEGAEAPDGIPVGIICLWSGTAGAIPTNWALCDGTNSTPDLRDRFIVGAGSTYANDASGNGTTSTGAGTAHTHTATVAGTALTIAQMPLHGHPWRHDTSVQGTARAGPENGILSRGTSGGSGTPVTRNAYTGAPSNTAGQQIGGEGGGQTHTHTATNATESAHTHPVSVIPKYYALAYIQYKGAP